MRRDIIQLIIGWSKKRRDDGTDDGTPGGRYAMHGPLSRRCLHATDTRRDTGPWRCSSDEVDDQTRLIARSYVVRHHVFMAALCNRAGHIYFHPVVSSFFLA